METSCAANARKLCDGDEEGQNRDVAVGNGVTDSSERLEVKRAIPGVQKVREKIPQFLQWIFANRDSREMPKPRNQRGDVVIRRIILPFFFWWRQKQRLAARGRKYRCSEKNLHRLSF